MQHIDSPHRQARRRNPFNSTKGPPLTLGIYIPMSTKFKQYFTILHLVSVQNYKAIVRDHIIPQGIHASWVVLNGQQHLAW